MIDWSIIQAAGPVDIAGNFARGYDIADKIITGVHQKNALAALAQNPDDQNALAHLYQANPAVAARMEEMNMKRHDVARETDARNALGHIVGAIGQQQFNDFRQPNAITGTMPEPVVVASVARDTPGTAVNAPSAAGDVAPPADAAPPSADDDPITITGKRPEPPAEVHPDLSEEWRTYAQSDPDGAMKTMIDRHKLNKGQAVDLAAQMDIIGRLAGSATDEASYQQALSYGKALGYDVSRLPPNFTPEAVAQIQQQSMTARDALKLKHDITDDEIDNARADKAMQLQHRDRTRGQDLSHEDRVRGQDVSADTTQRGQDISHEDRVRGQDIGSKDRQRGQDLRGKGKGKGGGIPHVKSVAEARALPVGTMFIDPQGNVRRR